MGRRNTHTKVSKELVANIHRLDDIILVGLMLQHLRGARLELVSEIIGLWSFAEVWHNRSLEHSLVWLDDHQIQAVSRGIVSVHTGLESALYEALGFLFLKKIILVKTVQNCNKLPSYLA